MASQSHPEATTQSTTFGRFVDRMNTPQQVRAKHNKPVAVFGRIGYCAKGVFYAVIGGLACKAAAGDKNADQSPQQALILVGSGNVGYPLLVLMFIGLFFYVLWRFWEGATGQGTDQNFPKWKNFFKFRVSPLVSGGVYTFYMGYVLYIIATKHKHDDKTDKQDCLLNCWNNTALGRAGLVMVGLAFLIATITQLDPALRGIFKREMYPNLPRWLFWSMVVTGHLGFLGRAGVFLFMAIEFFRSVGNDVNESHQTVANALNQLTNNTGGKIVLFFLGFMLIIYGLYCQICMWTRIFPTPPPTGLKRTQTRSIARDKPVLPVTSFDADTAAKSRVDSHATPDVDPNGQLWPQEKPAREQLSPPL
eukprot:jgi/Chlat1/4895/Chrsp31S00375